MFLIRSIGRRLEAGKRLERGRKKMSRGGAGTGATPRGRGGGGGGRHGAGRVRGTSVPPVQPSSLRHGCHPYAAALSPSVMAGSSFTHLFPLPASAATHLTYVAPSLPAWCRPSANDAAVCQRPARPNVARVVRVSVAPRARHVRRSRFHHQQMGVVF
jgi:hypothetical protein